VIYELTPTYKMKIDGLAMQPLESSFPRKRESTISSLPHHSRVSMLRQSSGHAFAGMTDVGLFRWLFNADPSRSVFQTTRKEFRHSESIGLNSFAAGLLFLAVFGFGHCALAQNKLVRIGIPSFSIQEIPLAIAQKRGFFAAQGLNVELIQIAGSPATAALLAGEVDYITHSSRVIALAAINGGVRVIFNHVARPLYYLVTIPEIRNGKELRGKTVGISSFGGVSYHLTKLVLESFGLSIPKDVTLRPMGQDALRLAAMSGKSIQGTLLPPDHAVKATRLGMNLLTYSGDVAPLPMGGLGLTDGNLRDRRDQTKRVLRSLLQALRFLHEERQGAISVMANWLKMTPADAAAAYDLGEKIFGRDGIPSDAGMKLLLKTVQEDLKLPNEIASNAVSDFSLVREVKKELSIP
jgi:NitT/TauT family transport system substrate-binding protein